MSSELRMCMVALAFWIPATFVAQEAHVHPVPEKLGEVSFPISCTVESQNEFNRAVALLHSFAYVAAEEAFRGVLQQDPRCAMAHWGIAMSYYHQLWEPPIAPGSNAKQEIEQAQRLGAKTERERGFIQAASKVFQDPAPSSYASRALDYERAMAALAAANPKDVESQVFYALALLANAPPSDKTHARQKKAAGLLEPLYTAYPEHPGIPHYLIHAYDNAELAPRGLSAARAYAQIAPSAPHALHMPSHIFTRLGLWDDSIAANVAASAAAHQAGDVGEELHAMDYLVYAYLQIERDRDAAAVIEQLKAMPNLNTGTFKVGYAAVAMPIRYAVERRRWEEAASVIPPLSAPPHVLAIAVWARGVGLARSGHPQEAVSTIETLKWIHNQLQDAGTDYWATQVGILEREVQAWSSESQGMKQDAVVQLREAADVEDSVEKLPVTPGPILPAREQLGYMLLEQNQPELAALEFQTALVNSPGRAGAIRGAAECAAKLSAALKSGR